MGYLLKNLKYTNLPNIYPKKTYSLINFRVLEATPKLKLRLFAYCFPSVITIFGFYYMDLFWVKGLVVANAAKVINELS